MPFPGVTAPPPSSNGTYTLFPVGTAFQRALLVCFLVFVFVAPEGVVVAEALDGGGGAGHQG